MIVELTSWQVRLQEIREKYPIGSRVIGNTITYQKHGGKVVGHHYTLHKYYVDVLWHKVIGSNFQLPYNYTIETFERAFSIEVPFQAPTNTTYEIA